MFQVYIALGDSMSIDYYPYQAAEAAGLSTREEIGSASLLFRNEDTFFPEFAGRDLATYFPGIRHENLCIDGATTEDLLSEVRLKDVADASGGRALVTLTLGGNDLLQAYRRSLGSGMQALVAQFMELQERYKKVIGMVRERLPNCLIVLTTVFDPTDGTGIIPASTAAYEEKLPIEYLEHFNVFVKACARSEATILADVQKHFAGHGAHCGSKENFWYWPPSPIEPNVRGASEIRRVWLGLVEEYAGIGVVGDDESNG